MAHDKLTLTITANNNVEEKTIKHNQSIWEHLNALGDEDACMQRQQKCHQTHDGDDDDDEKEDEEEEEEEDAPPPKLSKEELFKAQRLIDEDFKRYMYEHSLQNLLWRLHGGLPENTGFESLKLAKGNELLSKQLQQSLDETFESLDDVFKLFAALSHELP